MSQIFDSTGRAKDAKATKENSFFATFAVFARISFSAQIGAIYGLKPAQAAANPAAAIFPRN